MDTPKVQLGKMIMEIPEIADVLPIIAAMKVYAMRFGQITSAGDAVSRILGMTDGKKLNATREGVEMQAETIRLATHGLHLLNQITAEVIYERMSPKMREVHTQCMADEFARVNDPKKVAAIAEIVGAVNVIRSENNEQRN